MTEGTSSPAALRSDTAGRFRATPAFQRLMVLGAIVLLVALYAPHSPAQASTGKGILRAHEMDGNTLSSPPGGFPSHAPRAARGLPWLHAVPGSPVGRLETPDGSYFPLRGVDVNGFIQYGPDWNESIPLTRSDLAEMHDLGLTFIRLSVSWSLLEPTPGVFNTSYLSNLSQVVDWAGTEGIYVLVDMHQDLYNRFLAPNGTEQDGFPAWATFAGNASRTCPVYLNQTTCLEDPAVDHAWNALWNDTTVPNFVGLQRAYDQAWQMLATVFANSSTVAGYDLMNEPATGDVTSSLGSGFCPNGTWEWEYQWEDCFLLPFYQTLISSIRQVDTHHAIFFEPSVYTDALNWAPWNPVSLGDPDVVYEPHIYTNVFGPTANWSGNMSALLSAYQNAVLNAQEFGNIAWFVGEYGTNPDPWHDRWIEANVNLANEFDVGSSFWEWKDGINASTVTEPGGSWGDVNGNGTLRNATARTEILASPHPVGAGEGARVLNAEFNFTTFRYDLTVANTVPGGWVQVYLPSFWYPSGYGVKGTYTGHSYANSTDTLPGGTVLETSLLNVTCSCTANYTVHVAPAAEAEGWLSGHVTPSFANVTVAGKSMTLKSGNFSLALPPGSVSVSAAAPGYVPQSRSVEVNVGNTTQVIISLTPLPPPSQYAVTFTESGLPPGMSWFVSLDGTPRSGTGSIAFSEPNGSYTFSVGAVAGYTASPTSSTVKVNGAGVSQSITFTGPPTGQGCVGCYSLDFTESGLPTGTNWSVTVGPTTHTSTGSTVSFNEINNTYVYSVGTVAHYMATPASGSATVLGASKTVSVTFTRSGGELSSPSGLFGLSGNLGYIILGLVVIAVVMAATALVLMRRKKDTRSPTPAGPRSQTETLSGQPPATLPRRHHLPNHPSCDPTVSGTGSQRSGLGSLS